MKTRNSGKPTEKHPELMKHYVDCLRTGWAAGVFWLVVAALPFAARADDGPFALLSTLPNSYASVPHNPALNPFPLTVTAWIKQSQNSNSTPLVAKYDAVSQNGWQIYLSNGVLLASYSLNNAISVNLSGGIINTSGWHHIAFVVDTTVAHLYVDGVLKSSLEWLGSACTTTQELRLANYQGALDEVTIWNVAQPQTWISTNGNRGWIGAEPGLVSYYRFNEGAGSIVIDSAGGLNGVTTNGATWVPGIILRPAVMTQPPLTVTHNSVTLQGIVNVANTNGSAWFEWGTSISYGNVTSPQSLGNGGANSNILQVLNGLIPGTVYYYRTVVSNSVGVTYGENISFRTSGNPALSFDGTNDFVSVPHNSLLNAQSLTATAWIKTTQATGEVGIINKYIAGTFNGWQLFLYQGNVRAWYFGDSTHYVWDGDRGLNGGPVTNGLWHHLALTVDNSGGRLFVDGAQKDFRAWTGLQTTCTTTQALSLAQYPGNPGGGFFKGAIDEVTIWNAAQPPEWLATNLNRGLLGSEPGILAYYRLNEATGIIASNSASFFGIGNGGLSNGPVWVSGVALRPALQSLPASNVGTSTATLNGIANPENTNSVAWFEWGATTNYGNATPLQALGSGNENININQSLSSLALGVFYHFRAAASNAVGVSYGVDQIFFTGGNMGTARGNFTLTPLPNGRVLAAGGSLSGGLALGTAELYDPASGTWRDTQPMLFPRYEHTATVLANGKVLVTGGNSGTSGGLAIAEVYDPVTETWSLTGSMTTNRIQHTATLLANGKVLLAGGYSQNSAGFEQDLSSAELYDPVSGNWSATGSMNTNRIFHTATLLPNGKVLVAGGRNGTNSLRTCQLYNPATGTWSVSGSLNEARHWHTTTLMPNGFVLAVGGISIGVGGVNSGFPPHAELYNPISGGWSLIVANETVRYQHTATLLPNGQVLAFAGVFALTADLYDPTTATWTSLSAPNSLSGHSAALLPNGKVLIAGGFVGSAVTNGTTATNAIYLWDISASIFNGNLAGTNSITGSLVRARAAHTATLLPNGQVLIAGGATNNYQAAMSSVETYDPATGTASATGSMTTNRVEHTATLLPNGKVLVTGGCTNGNPGIRTLATAELYDPATGLWAATGVMTTNRSHHTATLLPNGKVLVAGGATRSYNSFSNALKSAELYDPNTGAWRPTRSMLGAHSSHGAILLPNGKVLLAGGIGGSNVVTNNAELYDPTTETWTSTGPMTTVRSWFNLLLLFNGQVLASSLGTSELYDPDTGVWTPTTSMTTNRQFQAALLLPNGRVLVNGGRIGDGLNPFFFDVHSSSEIFDPIVGTWTPSGALHVSRYLHTMTLLPNGQTLIVGGLATNSVELSSIELFDTGLNFSNYWRPQITIATSPLALGGNFFLNGSNFRGLSEASGGNGCQDGASDFPVVQLRNLENGQSLFLDASTWQTNTFTSTPVWDFPPGYALATAFVNGIPSTGVVVNVSLPVPTPPALTHPTRLADGSFQFSFNNAVGALFGVWTATNPALPASNWTALGAVPEVAPGQFQFHDTQHPTDSRRFYRVRTP